jgi:hypothetical protein
MKYLPDFLCVKIHEYRSGYQKGEVETGIFSTFKPIQGINFQNTNIFLHLKLMPKMHNLTVALQLITCLYEQSSSKNLKIRQKFCFY